jgi:hypothetical protein
MLTQYFKYGFMKSAFDKGYTTEESEAMYNHEVSKVANSDYSPEDFQNIKDMLAERGKSPAYNVDDTHPYAREYNQDILKLRDKYYDRNPDIEGVKSGVGHGILGGVAGFGAGHLAGEAASSLVNPKYTSLVKHLPGWSRAVGLGIGALAGGVKHFNKTKQDVTSLKKLTHPGNMQTTFDTLSKERQFANNQLGTYRAL